MLTKDELWDKAGSDDPITLEDIGLPSWRSECDGFYYEVWHPFCRSGIFYKHKDGYRWANGDFLTKRQLRLHGLIDQ